MFLKHPSVIGTTTAALFPFPRAFSLSLSHPHTRSLSVFVYTCRKISFKAARLPNVVPGLVIYVKI